MLVATTKCFKFALSMRARRRATIAVASVIVSDLSCSRRSCAVVGTLTASCEALGQAAVIAAESKELRGRKPASTIADEDQLLIFEDRRHAEVSSCACNAKDAVHVYDVHYGDELADRHVGQPYVAFVVDKERYRHRMQVPDDVHLRFRLCCTIGPSFGVVSYLNRPSARPAVLEMSGETVGASREYSAGTRARRHSHQVL